MEFNLGMGFSAISISSFQIISIVYAVTPLSIQTKRKRRLLWQSGYYDAKALVYVDNLSAGEGA